VPLVAADQMVVEVDTVSAATTFDPYFDVYVGSVFGNVAGGADDSFDCTFPPPNYQCPSDTIDAEATGNYIIDVAQASSGDCVGSIAEYDLNITVNGLPVLGFLYEDNVAP
jgi:hypothetical protein